MLLGFGDLKRGRYKNSTFMAPCKIIQIIFFFLVKKQMGSGAVCIRRTTRHDTRCTRAIGTAVASIIEGARSVFRRIRIPERLGQLRSSPRPPAYRGTLSLSLARSLPPCACKNVHVYDYHQYYSGTTAAVVVAPSNMCTTLVPNIRSFCTQ